MPILHSWGQRLSGWLNSKTWSFTRNHTDGRSLVLLVAATAYQSPADLTVSAATYNGVAADNIITHINVGYPSKTVAVCYWANPGAQTNKTVTITWSGPDSSKNIRTALALDIETSAHPSGTKIGAIARAPAAPASVSVTSATATANIQQANSLVIVWFCHENADVTDLTLNSPITSLQYLEIPTTTDALGPAAKFGSHVPSATGNQNYVCSAAVANYAALLVVEFLPTSAVDGSSSVNLAPATLSATASIEVSAALDVTLGAVGFEAYASSLAEISATATPTLGDVTASATGAVPGTGVVQVSLQDATLAATTGLVSLADSFITLADAVLSAQGTRETAASAGVTLLNSVLVSTGVIGAETIQWPGTLPVYLSFDSFREHHADNLIVTTTERGPALRRRRQTNIPKLVEGRLRLTDVQLADFETFYYAALESGRKSFSWKYRPTLSEIPTVSFVQPPIVNAVSGKLYDVELELEAFFTPVPTLPIGSVFTYLDEATLVSDGSVV